MNVGSLIGLVLLPLSLGNCAYFAPISMPQSYDISQRIKARCGIPDSVKWSNRTRLIYGKQIEKEILTINTKYK
jgi:hypothetical protein